MESLGISQPFWNLKHLNLPSNAKIHAIDRKKKLERNLKYVANYLMENPMPAWFRGLSHFQLREINKLFSALRDDNYQGTTHRVQNCLHGIGLQPMVSSYQIHDLIKFSRCSDIAFLWFLMEAYYKRPKGEGNFYDINEQLLLSCIAHLDMISTMRALDKVLPEALSKQQLQQLQQQQQQRQQKETQSSLKSSSYQQNRNNLTRNYQDNKDDSVSKPQLKTRKTNKLKTLSRVLPYFVKLVPPKRSEQKPTSLQMLTKVSLHPYDQHRNANYVVPGETNRWFAEYPLQYSPGEKAKCIKNALEHICDELKSVDIPEDTIRNLWAQHQDVQVVESSLFNQLVEIARNKYKEFLNNKQIRNSETTIERMRHQLVAEVKDCMHSFHILAKQSRKQFIYKTLALKASYTNIQLKSVNNSIKDKHQAIAGYNDTDTDFNSQQSKQQDCYISSDYGYCSNPTNSNASYSCADICNRFISLSSTTKPRRISLDGLSAEQHSPYTTQTQIKGVVHFMKACSSFMPSSNSSLHFNEITQKINADETITNKDSNKSILCRNPSALNSLPTRTFIASLSSTSSSVRCCSIEATHSSKMTTHSIGTESDGGCSFISNVSEFKRKYSLYYNNGKGKSNLKLKTNTTYSHSILNSNSNANSNSNSNLYFKFINLNRLHSFNYKEIFNFQSSDDVDMHIRRAFIEAIDSDIHILNILHHKGVSTLAVHQCTDKMIETAIDDIFPQTNTATESQRRNPLGYDDNVYYDPNDNKLMDDMLEKALIYIAKNPRFVLPCLPDAHRHPVLQEWIRLRYGKSYTIEEQRESLNISNGVFNKLNTINFHVVLPASRFPKFKYTDYNHRDALIAESENMRRKFYKRLDNAIMTKARILWYAMKPWILRHQHYDTIFAYLPSKPGDLSYFNSSQHLI